MREGPGQRRSGKVAIVYARRRVLTRVKRGDHARRRAGSPRGSCPCRSCCVKPSSSPDARARRAGPKITILPPRARRTWTSAPSSATRRSAARCRATARSRRSTSPGTSRSSSPAAAITLGVGADLPRHRLRRAPVRRRCARARARSAPARRPERTQHRAALDHVGRAHGDRLPAACACRSSCATATTGCDKPYITTQYSAWPLHAHPRREGRPQDRPERSSTSTSAPVLASRPHALPEPGPARPSPARGYPAPAADQRSPPTST